VIKRFIDLRPADTLNFTFLFLLITVTLLFYQKMPSSALLASVYFVMISVQILLIRVRDKNGLLRISYDLLFPLLCIVAIFESLEYVVHFINPIDIDPVLVKFDYAIFSGHPTVMLERFASPLLTEIMQLAYTSFYFLPIILGLALKIKKTDQAFERSLFLTMLCFYLSYAGYMITPALGPRYTINHLQNVELHGLYIADQLHDLLNRLEGIKRDAFPSGHTAVALTVLYLSFLFEKRLFWIFLPCVILLIFSAVYCRYHYVVDILAGAVLTAITLFLGETYYAYWKKRIDINY
jgi:membrane-associated phospholipid phosphatase